MRIYASLRLKGGLFSVKDFNVVERIERPKRYEQPDLEREAVFTAKLERLTSMRRLYHLQRYGLRDEPDPHPLEPGDPNAAIEPLNDYLERVLGDEAVRATDEAIEQAPSTQRQKRRQEMREEEELEQRKQKTMSDRGYL